MPDAEKPAVDLERPGAAERLRGPAAVAGYVAFYSLLAVFFVCLFLGGFAHPVTIAVYVLVVLVICTAVALNLEGVLNVLRTRKAAAGGSVLLSLAAALGILFAALWLSFRYHHVIDFTEDRRFTLDEKTMQWLGKLEGEGGGLRIATFLPYNPPRMAQLPRDYKEQVLELLKLYDRSPGIEVVNVDPVGETRRTEAVAATFGMKPQDVPVGSVVLKLGEKMKTVNASDMFLVLPGVEPEFIGEDAVTSAVRDILDERPRKVYFVTGHGERAIGPGQGDYGHVVARLKGMNFTVREIGLLGKEVVPDDADCLVFAGPKAPLLEGEIRAVRGYLARGGKLAVMLDRLDPGADEAPSGLERVLADHGVAVYQDALAMSAEMGYLRDRILGRPDPRHQVTSRLRGRLAVFYRACVLETGASRRPGYRANALVVASPGSYGERTPEQSPSKYNEGEDVAGPAALVAVVAPDKPSGGGGPSPAYIVVFADADFAANRSIRDPVLPDHVNVDLFLNAVNWMVGRTENIGITRSQRESRAVVMTPSRRRRFFWGAVVGPSLLMVVLGIVVWRLRSR